MNSDELFYRKVIIKANVIVFSNTFYMYRNNTLSISKVIAPKIFDRLIVDKQIEDFVYQNYSVHSIEAYRIRNTRFFNYIHLQHDYFHFRKAFSFANREKIQQILSNNYQTLNKSDLNKELPIHLRLFLMSYFVFKFLSLLYVWYKEKRGKEYIYK